MIRSSSPSILISEPLYLPNRTRSPCFDVEGLAGAVFLIFAFADCDDFAFLGFFLGRVGDDDAAPHLLALFDTLTMTRS
jgi:hypothetical protein